MKLLVDPNQNLKFVFAITLKVHLISLKFVCILATNDQTSRITSLTHYYKILDTYQVFVAIFI